VASATVIFLLDDLLQLARGRTELVAVMAQARNVRRGAPVWIAGKPVGEVVAVEILPRGQDTTTRVALLLEIESRHVDQVNRGSRVRLTSDRFIGEPAVDIVPGLPTSGPISPRDTIYARAAASVSALRRRALALNVAIDSLNAASARVTASAAGKRAGALDMQRTLAALQREFAALTTDLQSAPGLRALEDPRLRQSLDRFASTTRALAQAFADPGPGATSAADVAAGIATLQQRARALTQDIAALQVLMHESGTLPRLQRDSALLRAFHGVRASLDSLVKEASKNPGRFIF
jgi:ABC-type transporter Mla subunit MlaD